MKTHFMNKQLPEVLVLSPPQTDSEEQLLWIPRSRDSRQFIGCLTLAFRYLITVACQAQLSADGDRCPQKMRVPLQM